MTDGEYELEALLKGVQLSALPQSAVRLLELSKDPENGPPEFAIPIEADPGLTGQVLRFVNSSYFGFAERITSVRLAVALVGVRTIKNFAVWSAVFSLIPNPKCGPFNLKSLWQDSLRRALFARKITEERKTGDMEEAFTAALLQDMAIPVLAKALPKEYAQMLDQRTERLSRLEQDRFGWTHGDAAAAIVGNWGLPNSFVQSLRSHSQTEQWGDDPLSDEIGFAVGLSALLPRCDDDRWPELHEAVRLCERFCGLDEARWRDLLAEVDHDFADFAPSIQVSTQATPLIQQWEAEVAEIATD